MVGTVKLPPEKAWQRAAIPHDPCIMHSESASLSRRAFVKTLSVASAGLAATTTLPSRAQDAAPKRHIKLGLDNFAVRDMGWKAPQLIDYAAKLKTDSLFITDFDALEKTDDAYLQEMKSRAADKGLQIQLGTWSICPTSKSFKNKWGNADELLALGLRMAKALGSSVLRVVLGSGEDRKTEEIGRAHV